MYIASLSALQRAGRAYPLTFEGCTIDGMRNRCSSLSSLLALASLLLIAFVITPRASSQSAETTARKTQEDLLSTAKAEASSGHLDEAIAGFNALLQRDKSEVPVDLRAEALQGLYHAQIERRRELSRPLPALKFLWDEYFLTKAGAVLFILFLLRVFVLRFIPGGRIAIAFEDLTSVPAGITDPKTRLDSNKALTSSVLALLENPAPIGIADLHMDIMPGSQEPGFGGLRSTFDTGLIAGFVPSDHQMKIASVEFNPRDIFGYLTLLFRVPPRTIRGWVNEGSDRSSGFAQLLHRSGKPVSGSIWQATAAGENSRDQVIADLAAQIIVHLKKTHLTSNWRSFRAFHQGVRMLQQGKQVSPAPWQMEEARHCFEQAIMYDAANWFARFHLALILCKKHRSDIAIAHFNLLGEVMEGTLKRNIGLAAILWRRTIGVLADTRRKLQNAPESCDTSAQTRAIAFHLRRYPECPFIVIYNRALALSDFHNKAHCDEALASLDKLANLGKARHFNNFLQCERRLSNSAKAELRLYCLSAQANILAGRYVSESKTSSGDRTVLDEMRQRVKRLMHDLVSLCEARRQEHWRSLQTARAVALSAYARVLDADGDGMEAAAKLYEALAAEPDFVDARLQLAKLHMKYRRALSNEWPLRARLYLLSAMQLNPNCEDAQLLLAELYSDPAVDQISEAEHLLTALTSGDKHNTAAYLQLARLKLRTSKPEAGKIEATEQLCLHIRVSGTFSESADYVFNEILEGTAAWNALRSHLSRVSDALRLVRDGAPKTALDERARIARAMAAIDGLQIAESQAQGAAV